MHKSTPVMAIIAISLAACAAAQEKPRPRGPASTEFVTGFDPAVTRKPEACVINVFVDEEFLVVDQEPALSKLCGGGGGKAIAWKLDKTLSGYSFVNKDDVWFKGTGASKPINPDCQVLAAGKGIRCTFDPPAKGTSYPYGIRVHRAAGADLELDPTIFNN